MRIPQTRSPLHPMYRNLRSSSRMPPCGRSTRPLLAGLTFLATLGCSGDRNNGIVWRFGDLQTPGEIWAVSQVLRDSRPAMRLLARDTLLEAYRYWTSTESESETGTWRRHVAARAFAAAQPNLEKAKATWPAELFAPLEALIATPLRPLQPDQTRFSTDGVIKEIPKNLCVGQKIWQNAQLLEANDPAVVTAAAKALSDASDSIHEPRNSIEDIVLETWLIDTAFTTIRPQVIAAMRRANPEQFALLKGALYICSFEEDLDFVRSLLADVQPEIRAVGLESVGPFINDAISLLQQVVVSLAKEDLRKAALSGLEDIVNCSERYNKPENRQALRAALEPHRDAIMHAIVAEREQSGKNDVAIGLEKALGR